MGLITAIIANMIYWNLDCLVYAAISSSRSACDFCFGRLWTACLARATFAAGAAFGVFFVFDPVAMRESKSLPALRR
jgi:hypothetical protein